MEQICSYGCNQKAIRLFKSTNTWCCSVSVNKCPAKRERDSKNKRGKNPFEGKEHPRGMLGKSYKHKGKKLEEFHSIEKASEIKSKISNSLSGRDYEHKSEESKIKHSQNARNSILKRFELGWMPKAGRCKKIKYYSEIAGNVSLDGNWELDVAKWLDYKGLNWKRNTKKFLYKNLQDKDANYTPDFLIEDNCRFYYIEVKGYETDLDRCKWSQFTDELIIFRKDQIIKIREELESGSTRICT
jgi:hypothetical protein